MTIQVGTPAPDFTLYNSDKHPVTLSSLRDKNVVLLFFPLAFTSTCTVELCSTRDHISDYEDLNAEVLAISVDTPQTLHKWKELEHFNFQLLSDFNKEASTLYDSLYETFSVGLKGVSKRSAFVIDKQGIVRYAEVLEKAGDLPNIDAVKACLASINAQGSN